MRIYELPDVPEEVVEAGLAGELVLFIGAGISRMLGLPSWAGMASQALEQLRQAKAIDYSGKDQLSRLDARKQLSIAQEIARNSGVTLDYKKMLTPASADLGIYDHLNEIGCVCVTTNYDELLNPRFYDSAAAVAGSSVGPKPVVRVSDRSKLLPKLLDEPGTVVHLHGSIGDPATMVIATKDYLEHYDHEMVQTFLGQLFEKKTVLFLGYGLDESEILEHILRRGRVSSTANRRRFSLQGFFRSETMLYEHLSSYFQTSFGVHLIGFERDKLDYGQQLRIVQQWATEVRINKPSMITDIAALSEALADE